MQRKQKHAYLYRFYPSDGQRKILACTFGCARFVYNWALHLRSEAHAQEQQRVSYHDTSAQLTRLKQQDYRAWLNEVSSVPLQQALRHLERAFRNFFEGRAAYPKFKSKHGVQSAEYTTSAFKWDGGQLSLAKMEEPLHIIWSRPLPAGCKPTTVTVSKDTADRYFVSLLVEEDIDALPLTTLMVGVDVGIKAMVALSSGETVENPGFYVKAEKRLARAQRRLSRKKKGSKNRAKARSKVARLHAKIADKRRDFQHKLSTRIIRENQVICVESLSVKNMLKNHCLAKHICDVGWGEFIRQLEYKSAWYGRTLTKIDRWYPSSKTCSSCRHVLENLSLDHRFWTCPACGTIHDRDINASKNILAEGLSVDACGGRVRPARVRTRQASPIETGSPSS
jgi:putative transposase